MRRQKKISFSREVGTAACGQTENTTIYERKKHTICHAGSKMKMSEVEMMMMVYDGNKMIDFLRGIKECT